MHVCVCDYLQERTILCFVTYNMVVLSLQRERGGGEEFTKHTICTIANPH